MRDHDDADYRYLACSLFMLNIGFIHGHLNAPGVPHARAHLQIIFVYETFESIQHSKSTVRPHRVGRIIESP